MNKKLKRGLIWGMAFLAYANSFIGSTSSVNPFYNQKTEDHYGLNVSIYNNNQKSITGVNVGFANVAGDSAEMNGLEISLLNWGVDYAGGTHARGAQIGIANVNNEHEGVQIGLINKTNELTGVQIGIINYNAENDRWTLGVNWDF